MKILLAEFFDVIYFDLPFEFSGRIVVAAVSVATRATLTTAVLSASVAAVGDVLVLYDGTRALVNLLPTHLTGKLLAELDAYRCTQTAPALVGCQHLGRCNSLVALLVLSVLHGSVQVGINRNELLATGTRKPFKTLACTVFMYSATAAFIIEGSILVLRHASSQTSLKVNVPFGTGTA